MPADSNMLLLNRTDYDSANDGAGTGTDATTGGGAVLSVAMQADLAVVMYLGEADATVANTTETLDMNIEVSDDGGSTWGRLATFRQITASELKSSGNTIDESAGDPTFRRAIAVRVAQADSGQLGLVQVRTNGTASDTNQWAVYVALVDRGSVRDVHFNNAQAV
jgi:hypothetical protein